MTLFRRNNDVVIALCVRWDRTTLPLRPRLHYMKHTVHWLYRSGCWFHLGSAYLHIFGIATIVMEPTTVGSLWLENDLHENELEFESHIWEDRKKCPRYFRRDSRGNPRDLNMCRTSRSAALSRGRKSMPPRRESMKLVVQQRKFT